MKTILLAIASIFILVSCKKDYSCECVSNGETTIYQIENKTKPRASEICHDYGNQTMLNSQGTAGSCKFIPQ